MVIRPIKGMKMLTREQMIKATELHKKYASGELAFQEYDAAMKALENE